MKENRILRISAFAGAVLFFATAQLAWGQQLNSITFLPIASSPACNASSTGQLFYLSTGGLTICNGSATTPIVTGASNSWTLSGSNLYPNSTSYNVGIGTASPGAALDVVGVSGLILDSGVVTTYSAPIRFQQAGITRFRILTGGDGVSGDFGFERYDATGTYLGQPVTIQNSTGNVGINTISPGTNLDVNGNIQSSIYYDRDNTNYYLDLAANTMPYSALFAGKVGIGTTGPGTSLEIAKRSNPTDIVGSPNNPSIRIRDTYSDGFNGKAEVQFVVGNNLYPTAAITDLYTTWASPGASTGNVGSDLLFSTRYATDPVNTLTERMRITGSGNVGIGTTNPGQTLTVNGTASIAGVTNIASPVDTTGVLNVQTTGTDRIITLNGAGGTTTSTWWMVVNPNYSSYSFNLWSASGGDLFRLLHNGSGYFTNGPIGIGTTVPTTAGLVVATNVSGAAIDATNDRIINLGTPINAADAATKSYVDSAITTGVSGGITGTANYIAKFTSANTVGNSLIFDNGTNVGIGTASP